MFKKTRTCRMEANTSIHFKMNVFFRKHMFTSEILVSPQVKKKNKNRRLTFTPSRVQAPGTT